MKPASGPWSLSAMALAINAAIVAFNASLIVVMWYAVIGLIRTDRQNTIDAAFERNSNLAIVLEQYARRTIESADAAMHYLINAYARDERAFDVGRFTANYAASNRAFIGLAVADEQGKIATTAYVDRPAEPVMVADREHFRVHRGHDTGKLHVGKPVTDRITGKASIPVTRRVNRPDGSFGGVAMALIEPGRFVDVLDEAKLRSLDTTALVGLDGITRARLRGTTVSAGEDISKGQLFAEQSRRPAGRFTSRGQLDGVPKLFSYRTLPDYPLISVIGTAQEDVLAEHHRRRDVYYRFATVATLLIVAFTALAMIVLASQRRAAATIARSQARFLATFNQAAVGIAHSTLDGRYLEANDKLCDLLGYSREELLARTFVDITHPDDVSSSIDARRKLVGNPDHTGLAQREKRYVRKDGTAVWCLVAPSVVHDDDGKPEYVASVIQDISERKQAEAALNDYAERMRLLSQRLSEAEENERRKINRELHDRVGQNLSVLNLNLGRLRAHDSLPETGRKLLDDARTLTERTIRLVRDVMANLRPPALDDFGLLAALRNHVDAFTARTGLAVELTGEALNPRPPLAVETALYRIAQEALNNVAKHANARRVEVALKQDPGSIGLSVIDDGAGFVAGSAAAPRASWGLSTMRERADAIGAALRIESAPGQGTRVTLELKRGVPA